MLQRVQTIFMLLVILFMMLSFFFPIWILRDDTGGLVYELMNYQLTMGSGNEIIYFPYAVVASLAATVIVVAMIEIAKYSNRLLQMKLGALNALLMAATIVVSVYFYTNLMNTAVAEVSAPDAGAIGAGLFLPGVAMICNILANRFIRKDERLVRSVDRIR